MTKKQKQNKPFTIGVNSCFSLYSKNDWNKTWKAYGNKLKHVPLSAKMLRRHRPNIAEGLKEKKLQ